MNEVDKYVSQFEPEIQNRLNELRQLFFQTIPETGESIRYKIPAYKVGNDHLYFAAYKKHIGFYPVYGLTEIEEELSNFRAKGTKDSLHFLHSQSLPIELIKKIIMLKSKSENQPINFNAEVTRFLDAQNHPLRKEIEILRACILSADSALSENIKWNSPNYCLDNEDRITMRIQPLTTKQVQIIFHRGAKKGEQPKDKLIVDKSGLLLWKENDRAVATFKNGADVESRKEDLSKIVAEWIKATT